MHGGSLGTPFGSGRGPLALTRSDALAREGRGSRHENPLFGTSASDWADLDLRSCDDSGWGEAAVRRAR